MSAKEQLLRSLAEEKNLDEAKAPERIAEWKGAIERLFQSFREWLKAADPTQLLRVQTTFETIDERHLGAYQVPVLRITTSRGAVVAKPRALFVVGGLGRVDLQGPSKRLMLVRTAIDQWQFASLTPGKRDWSNKALTEEAFWEALQELLF